MREFIFINDKFDSIKVVDFLKSKRMSLEIIKKIKYGGIYLNGLLLNNVNNYIKQFDQIKIVLPLDEVNPYITAKKGKLKVIYEDEYILAVVKEKGVLTHSSKNNQTISLEQLILGYFLPNNFTFRAINRLDRDTSGIVLIAKDMFTASLLGEQMKNGEIRKTYSALVVGEPTESHFFIEKPIRRLSQDSMKRICAIDGKYAKSECKLIKSQNGLSLIDVTLHTGRTHQIRVHLSSVGLPLYADSLYGEKVDGKGYFLHAKKIEFIHPFNNKKIELISEMEFDE